MANRIGWLDASRGLCFACVVYFHLATTNQVVQSYFTPFFVSLFFFVSGYLYKSGQPFSVIFEQRTRTLFIPLLIFGFGGSLTVNLLKHCGFADSLAEALKNVLYQDVASQHAALWFFAALYVYSLAFYFVLKLCKRTYRTWLVALVLLLGNYWYKYIFGGPLIPWHLDKIGFGCFFMLMGHFYKQNEVKLDGYVGLKTTLVAVALFILVNYANGHVYVDFFGSDHLVDAVLLYVTSFCVVIYFSKHILCKSRFLLFIGSNTLIYFALHRVVMLGAEKLLLPYESPFFVNDVAVFGFSLVNCLVILSVLIIPTLLINRFCPCILGKGWKMWG